MICYLVWSNDLIACHRRFMVHFVAETDVGDVRMYTSDLIIVDYSLALYTVGDMRNCIDVWN
jgi:hypothetical protein